LRFYGIATWGAFRQPEGSRDYINLAEVAELARQLVGDQHHFCFVQLPFNLAMLEAHGLGNQGAGKNRMSLLAAASALGIAAVGSATLLQGQLTQGMPESLRRILGMKTDAEAAIQFSRSAPGLMTSLVGMGHRGHVTANLIPASVPPTPPEDWKKLFSEG